MAVDSTTIPSSASPCIVGKVAKPTTASLFASRVIASTTQMFRYCVPSQWLRDFKSASCAGTSTSVNSDSTRSIPEEKSPSGSSAAKQN